MNCIAGVYWVYFATAVSNSSGAVNSWSRLATTKLGTNPNDGAVLVDPNYPCTLSVHVLANSANVL